MSMVGTTGFFSRASPSSTTMGSSSRGLQANRASSCSMITTAVSGSSPAPVPRSRPSTRNRAAPMTQAGMVVHSWERIWLHRSVPAQAGARLVVSDMGEILSPNTEPATTAPPMMPMSTPWPWARAMHTTPAVPAADQLEPVMVDMMVQARKAPR